MKEIVVATLTSKEMTEAKKLKEMVYKIEELINEFQSARSNFWLEMVSKHSLQGSHYIKGNTICRQELG